MVVVELMLLAAGPAQAASTADFGSVSNSIGAAFVAIQGADQSGGNVSSMVARLNLALNLVEKAQAENATDPVLAATDLHGAESIAVQVSGEAPSVAQTGEAMRQTQVYLFVVSAVVILSVAVAIYIYGGRLYHLVWLRLYSKHEVRRIG